LQGAFGFIRFVIEISGYPATLTWPNAFPTPDSVVTGLDGRNGVYTVDVPIVDGCPVVPWQSNSPDVAASTGVFFPSATSGQVTGPLGAWSREIETGGFTTLTRERDARMGVILVKENGTNKLSAGVAPFFQNQVGSMQSGDYLMRTSGISFQDSDREPPADVNFPEESVIICDELYSGFTVNPKLFIGSNGTINITGHVEVNLL
jgi:hypothetical protein